MRTTRRYQPGDKIGPMLELLEGPRYRTGSHHNSYWLVRCSCGNVKEMAVGNLTRKDRKGPPSCGCLSYRDTPKWSQRTKGNSTYHCWNAMQHRTKHPTAAGYEYYGGRGITVCDRWASYDNFLADMGPQPAPGYTVERKDNDKGYEPSNCEWLHISENARRANIRNAPRRVRDKKGRYL